MAGTQKRSGTRKPRSLAIGLRVKHLSDGRSGLIIGQGQPSGLHSLLYPVAIEGSTRSELWPERLIKVQPKRQQFSAHGGTFKAPPGYPLYTNDRKRKTPTR